MHPITLEHHLGWENVKTCIRVILLVAIPLMSACATWTYDNQSYATSAEATEAARQDVRRKVSAVHQRESVLADSVLIYTPSLAWARRAVLTDRNATEEQIRYVATVLYYGFYGMAEAVERRGIFNTVHIQEFSQRDPLSSPQYGHILWLRLDGPDMAQWMLSPGNDTSSAKPIFTSPTSDPGDRISRFVQSVEQQVSIAP